MEDDSFVINNTNTVLLMMMIKLRMIFIVLT